jgi:hypothetical protein
MAPRVPDELLMDAYKEGLSDFHRGIFLGPRGDDESEREFLHEFVPFLARDHVRGMTEAEFGAFYRRLVDAIVEDVYLRDRPVRLRLFGALASALPDERIPAALSTVLQIGDVDRRIEALESLSGRLAPEQVAVALEHVRAMPDEPARAHGLGALAACLPVEQLDAYLAESTPVVDGHAYAEVVGAFVCHQPEATLRSAAWHNAIALGGRAVFGRVLEGVPQLPEALQRRVLRAALDEVRTNPNPGPLTGVLFEQLDRVPEAARGNLVRTTLLAGQVLGMLFSNLVSVLSWDVAMSVAPQGNARYEVPRLLDIHRRLPHLHRKLTTAELQAQAAADTDQAVEYFEAAMQALPTELRTAAVAAARAQELKDLLVVAAAGELARHVPAALTDTMLTAGRSMEDPMMRAYVLANMVEALPPEAQPAVAQEAVQALQYVRVADHYWSVCVTFGSRLPPPVAAPVTAAILQSLLPEEWGRAEAEPLAACLTALPPGLKAQAFRELYSVYFDHVEAMAKDKEPPDEAGEAEEPGDEGGLPTWAFERWRQHGLGHRIFKGLPDEQWGILLEIALRLPDEWERAQALMEIDSRLPEPWARKVLEALKALSDPWQRTEALTWVAEHLPDELSREAVEVALASARRVKGDSKSPLLATIRLQRTLSVPGASGDQYPRALALAQVAPHLPLERQQAVLEEALADVRRIEDGVLIWRFWFRLADYLPEHRLRELFDAVREHAANNPDLGGPFFSTWRSFFSLTHDLPESMTLEALVIVREIEDAGLRLTVMGRIATHLTGEARERVVREAFALLCDAEEDTMAAGMGDLAQLLPVDLQNEALALARRIRKPEARAGLLRALSPHLAAELTDAAIAAALDINDEAARLRALSRIVERLPPSLKEQVEGRVKEFEEQDATALGLLIGLGMSPEEFNPAWVEPDWDLFYQSVRDPDAAETLRSRLLNEGAQLLGDSRYRPRHELLKQLAVMAPALALGRTAFIEAIFDASRDVARWYP